MALNESQAGNAARADKRRKIYDVVEDTLKGVFEIYEISTFITACLNRMDNSPLETKGETAVKEIPFDEMDLFQKIGYVNLKLKDEVDRLKNISERLNGMV